MLPSHLIGSRRISGNRAEEKERNELTIEGPGTKRIEGRHLEARRMLFFSQSERMKRKRGTPPSFYLSNDAPPSDRFIQCPVALTAVANSIRLGHFFPRLMF